MSASSCLRVTHVTRYDYRHAVELAHHVAYLRPRQTSFQRVLEFGLKIAPQASNRTGGVDAYGNERLFFSLYLPHRALAVESVSVVEVGERLAADALPAGPPWEAVAHALRYRAEGHWVAETEFVFASPYVPLFAELKRYALESFTPGRGLLEAALELMHRVHADFTYETASTDIGTPLPEVFEMRCGVCQDFAHIMVGCLRSVGIAARYVSGYLLTTPPPGSARLIGADASHAWAEVYCPDLPDNGGWLDLDPTNDLVVGCDHVTLAIGRDYGDVTPLRGVIRGGGEHRLRVGVTVEPLEPLKPLGSLGPAEPVALDLGDGASSGSA